MSEQQLTTQNGYTAEQLSAIEKKGLSWKEFGEGAAKVEIQLIENSESMIKRAQTALPKTIDDVGLAEATLKNLSSDYLRSEEERKQVTSKFDKLTERFMAPNKSVQPHLTALRNAIIDIKTAYEKEQKSVEEKKKEVIYIREYLANQVNAFDAGCKTKITNLISLAYTNALGKGNIGTVDALKTYLEDRVKKGLSAKDFIYNPTMPKLVHVTEQEYAEMIEAIEIPTDYVKLFHDDVDKQFSDYETAWHNKEQALINQKKEAADKEKAIAEEKANKDVAAKLEASAVPIVDKTEVKALKKLYVVDNMEDVSEENAMKIMSAYIANLALARTHIRLKNWLNLSPMQMAGALQKIKNDDNAFEVTGIVWKEVSKL